jgi:hypothetical protein
METRFEMAGRDCGSNEIPGVESVTARLILEEMLVRNEGVRTSEQRHRTTVDYINCKKRAEEKEVHTCHWNRQEKWQHES